MQNDLSLMWYVASPDETMGTFDPITGSIFGNHDSVANDYWLSYKDSASNLNALYHDELGNSYLYDSTYYSALYIDCLLYTSPSPRD